MKSLTSKSAMTAAAVIFSLIVLPATSREARAEEKGAGEKSITEGGDESMPEAVKEVVKITDQGMVPSTITLEQLDSSVFFVNGTKDSLVTLSIDFGGHTAHCSTSNLKFEGGTMHSVEPIGPKDFALMCFPQSGTYDVKIEGVAGRTGPVVGKVVVR